MEKSTSTLPEPNCTPTSEPHRGSRVVFKYHNYLLHGSYVEFLAQYINGVDYHVIIADILPRSWEEDLGIDPGPLSFQAGATEIYLVEE